MILAETQLIGRAQHAARGDAADHGFPQQGAGARNDGAGRRKHALHPGMGVGRAADDLDLRLAGVDEADLQPVGIGMTFRRHDRRHGEGLERLRTVLDPFDIVAEHDEPVDDCAERGVGVEMGLEPVDRRLHAAAPPESGPRTSEGMSSGRNP